MDEPTERRERLAALERLATEAESRVADFFRTLLIIHEEKLWEDGGYRSWNDYLLRRWEASKSTGWRWLKQGREILELEAAEETSTSSGTAPRNARPTTGSPATQAGASPMPRGKATAKAARPPKPHEPDVLDPPSSGQGILFVWPPATKDDWRTALAGARVKTVDDIVHLLTAKEIDDLYHLYEQAWQRTMAKTDVGVLPAARQRPSQKDCKHPANARIGKGCGLCRKDPV